MPPDENCTRPGLYHFNTYDLASRPLYTTPSTTLHEAVPGHHLQIALAQETPLPSFRAYGGWNAYIEGWALYSESLGVEMGIYEDDFTMFGHYVDEMFRACRLVVDTVRLLPLPSCRRVPSYVFPLGIHAKSWTRQQAIDYMFANTGLGMTDITSEIDRYIAWPGTNLHFLPKWT